MDHFQRIYAGEAATYDRLVAAEDAYGELAQRLEDLAGTAATIVDIGTGTGRLALPLCRAGSRVHGVDSSPAMLAVAREKLVECGGEWALSDGDARTLPIDDDWADGAVAGWIYGHFTEWSPATWEQDLAAAIAEMDRVVKSGGVEVVIDTLGTAVLEPGAPTPTLARYHALIEDMGFVRTVLRTDYRFSSVAEAVELLEWFFGLGEWARTHSSVIVPEFTGWWERRNRVGR